MKSISDKVNENKRISFLELIESRIKDSAAKGGYGYFFKEDLNSPNVSIIDSLLPDLKEKGFKIQRDRIGLTFNESISYTISWS